MFHKKQWKMMFDASSIEICKIQGVHLIVGI